MADGRDERRLAAILVMDVVGYSRLMGADEGGTLAALKALRKELWDPKIEEYGGRVVKTTGDGQLVEFSSVVGAVECAVDIQRALAQHNADLREDKRIILRIGINQGDVIVEGDDIYGDGVNIAARLEALSEPAGICISRGIRDLIRDKLPYPLDDLGDVEVKNIARAVRAFQVKHEGVAHAPIPPAKVANDNVKSRWLWPSIAAAALVAAVIGVGVAAWQPWVTRVEAANVSDMQLPLPDKPSIAVLPFVNLTGNPEDEFLPDGISEDITTALGSLPRLFVISRTTTSTYKGKPVTVKQVAEELGVRFVLEGSVQLSGDTMRVTAQLIDAVSGKHVWAENYDRDISDLFAVKDEIVLNIASNVSGELDSGETDQIARSGTESLKAWTLWKQGLGEFEKFTPAANALARELAERAIEIDPEFATAYALLASTYDLAARFGSEPPAEAHETALSLVNDALRLDGTSSYAYGSLAGIRQSQGELDLALEAAEKAADLGPNDYVAQGMLGLILNSVGRFREAVPRANLAMRLSPNYPAWVPSVLGDAHLALGEFALAEEAINLKLARENNPVFAWDGHLKLALIYSQTNREQEARQAISEARAAYPSGTISDTRGYTSFQNPAIFDGWARTWRRLGVPEVLEVKSVRAQDRVTGQELQALVSSPWWYGAGTRGKSAHWAFISRGEIEFSGPWAGPAGSIRGPLNIEDDHICGDFAVIGKYCAAYYRNPDGTRDNNDEYIVVGPSGTFAFSVYETRPSALEGK